MADAFVKSDPLQVNLDLKKISSSILIFLAGGTHCIARLRAKSEFLVERPEMGVSAQCLSMCQLEGMPTGSMLERVFTWERDSATRDCHGDVSKHSVKLESPLP